MIKLKFHNQTGTVLFEAFVALAVLSLGIGGLLRVFSESLYAGKMNTEKAVVTREVEKTLFDWFVVPERLAVADSSAGVHLATSERGHAYQLLLNPERLIAMDTNPEVVNGSTESKLSDSSPKRVYYKVAFQVIREDGAPIYEVPVILTGAEEVK